jgi:hypothetical protein
MVLLQRGHVLHETKRFALNFFDSTYKNYSHTNSDTITNLLSPDSKGSRLTHRQLRQTFHQQTFHDVTRSSY